MPINSTLDVVIQEDDLIVLGPPSSVDISLDIGSQGAPGSQIYTGIFDPNSITSEQFNVLYNASPKTKDIFIKTNEGESYGTFYSYVDLPGGSQWEIILEIYDAVDTFFTTNYESILAPFLVSPAFTGTPTSPTASVDTNTTQIATTAFVLGQAGGATPVVNGTAAVGTSFRYSRQDHVHGTDTTRAPLESPTFTGIPAAPTATAGTDTTQIATTNFVTTADNLKANITSPTFIGTVTVPTLSLSTADTATTATHYMVETATDGIVRPKTLANTRSEIVTTAAVNSAAATIVGTLISGTWQASEISSTYIDSAIARLASPTLTGTPNSPTASVDTNTTQIATTAFVLGQAGGATPLPNGTAAVGTSFRYSRQDHVHSSDPSQGAPLNSPTFTGTPTAPTASVDTNTTQIATTAFVLGQAGGATPVVNGTAAVGTSFRYSRQDHVHGTDTTRAPLESPTFTGTVAIPTLSLSTADTATTATHYMVETATDGIVRPKTLANTRTEIVTNDTMQSNIISPTSDGSNGIRKTTMSTLEPSGGSDGDLWLVYSS
jgi:hypothetical protein